MFDRADERSHDTVPGSSSGEPACLARSDGRLTDLCSDDVARSAGSASSLRAVVMRRSEPGSSFREPPTTRGALEAVNKSVRIPFATNLRLTLRRDAKRLALSALMVGAVTANRPQLWANPQPHGAQSGPPWTRPDKCTDNGFQAEKDIDTIRNWRGLYRAYQRYKACDDGAIAEGWSDIVVRLLTQEWNTLPTLNRLARVDKGFETFVLWHIDELMSPDESALIIKNAETRCPSNAKRLCQALGRKARNP